MQVSSPGTLPSPDQGLKGSTTSQATVSSGGGGYNTGTLPNETVSRRALDKVLIMLKHELCISHLFNEKCEISFFFYPIP